MTRQDRCATLDMVDAAIARGVARLVDELRRCPGGLWRDYGDDASEGSSGRKGSNVWAAAFIAAQVGNIPSARAAAAGVVVELLARSRRSGGWGYDENLLEDCDSTAWVLLAARATDTPVPRERLLAALRFILGHQDRSGGFVTYGPRGVQLFGEVAGRDGWFRPQPCVTAAALAVLASYADRRLAASAEASRYLWGAVEDGLWRPYWWYGFSYATYHAVRALTQLGPLPAVAAAATTRAVLDARESDGGWSGKTPGRSLAFPTALALLTLLTLGYEGPELETAIALLLDEQLDDGGFEPSAELLVPGGVTGEAMTMLDQGRFTTACVLHALHDYRARLSAADEEHQCLRT